MATGLLERVKFLGGDGGTPDVLDELPALDLGPDGLDPDPQPAPETRKKAKSQVSAETAAKQPRAGGKFVSTAKQTQQLADELELWLRMLAATWSITDEPCAGALNATSKVIAEDLARLGARSEWVMDKFQTTSLLGDCAKLAMHSWPLIKAIYRHHGGRAMLDEDQGDEHEAVTVEDGPVDVGRYGPWRPQNAT